MNIARFANRRVGAVAAVQSFFLVLGLLVISTGSLSPIEAGATMLSCVIFGRAVCQLSVADPSYGRAHTSATIALVAVTAAFILNLMAPDNHNGATLIVIAVVFTTIAGGLIVLSSKQMSAETSAPN